MYQARAVLGMGHQTTLDNLDYVVVERFIRQVKPVNHVLVAGGNRAGMTANAIATRLMRLGYQSGLVRNLTSAPTACDLLIICCCSGESDGVHTLIEQAKRRDINIVAITAQAESKLGRTADLTILIPPVESDFHQPLVLSFTELLFEQSVLVLFNTIFCTMILTPDRQ